MQYPNALIIIIFLWSGTSAVGFGQSNQPGYLITTKGDTISGVIQAIKWKTGRKLISHFIVRGPDGSEKTWEAKEVRSFEWGRTAPGLSPGNPVFHAKVFPEVGWRQFLIPVAEGRAQLFAVPDPKAIVNLKNDVDRVVFDSELEDQVDDIFYLSSPGTELAIRVEKENYEMVLKQVLKDCPELTEKIGQRKFRYQNLQKIIESYNGSCE